MYVNFAFILTKSIANFLLFFYWLEVLKVIKKIKLSCFKKATLCQVPIASNNRMCCIWISSVKWNVLCWYSQTKYFVLEIFPPFPLFYFKFHCLMNYEKNQKYYVFVCINSMYSRQWRLCWIFVTMCTVSIYNPSKLLLYMICSCSFKQ